MRLALTCLLLLIIVACTPAQADLPAQTSLVESNQASTTPPSQFAAPSATAAPSTIPTVTLLPSPTATWQICSPLTDIPIEQLAGMVTNPYNPPPPGSDDPHEGIDLSDILPGTQIAIGGRGVDAVLPGRVAAVILDRFPYGNAVMIETSLDSLPSRWIDSSALPTPDPSPPAPIALTCPSAMNDFANDSPGRSLYIIYAHLEQPPSVQIGDRVECGQTLGSVGMTGNALNPHLHLEVRVGPRDVQFPSMAHYDNSATLEEMAAYCAWRVSGRFQLVDPLKLFILNQ